MTDSIVIIPTYNEKENIEKIITAIFSLDKLFHILVIDDGSPDGTADIVKNLQKKLDVLGNNIANINTIGYKRSRITFADSFNQISKNGKLGTGLTKTQTLFNQGMLEATGNITYLAIQGNSFFVLNDGGN